VVKKEEKDKILYYRRYNMNSFNSGYKSISGLSITNSTYTNTDFLNVLGNASITGNLTVSGTIVGFTGTFTDVHVNNLSASGTITSSTIVGVTGDFTNIYCQNLTATGTISCSSLTGNSGSFVNLFSSSGTITTLSSNLIQAADIEVFGGRNTSLTNGSVNVGRNLQFNSADSTLFSLNSVLGNGGIKADSNNLNFQFGGGSGALNWDLSDSGGNPVLKVFNSGGNGAVMINNNLVQANSGSFQTLQGNNLYANSGTITTLGSNTINTVNLFASSGTITTLGSTTINSTNVTSSSGSFQTINSNNIYANSGTITTLGSNTINTVNLFSSSGTITTLGSSTANINNLTSSGIITALGGINLLGGNLVGNNAGGVTMSSNALNLQFPPGSTSGSTWHINDTQGNQIMSVSNSGANGSINITDGLLTANSGTFTTLATNTANVSTLNSSGLITALGGINLTGGYLTGNNPNGVIMNSSALNLFFPSVSPSSSSYHIDDSGGNQIVSISNSGSSGACNFNNGTLTLAGNLLLSGTQSKLWSYNALQGLGGVLFDTFGSLNFVGGNRFNTWNVRTNGGSSVFIVDNTGTNSCIVNNGGFTCDTLITRLTPNFGFLADTTPFTFTVGSGDQATNTTASIIPKTTNSLISITVSGNLQSASASVTKLTLYRNSTELSNGFYFSEVTPNVSTVGNSISQVSINYLDAPGTTSSVSYTVYGNAVSGTANPVWATPAAATISVTEVH
jgi:hypothetical protein